ncbi:MAG: FAD-dependent 5-carboxymethylaminomethyl-2-thiouridine(34) oxidoreductase MnmC [Hydrogenophilus sp.]|nr:FAD-dependent 5-carboxymethylaminomethyl-2-thiouridine(34) oxidoreductase MnmC [Hydrogenophilus sp.]
MSGEGEETDWCWKGEVAWSRRYRDGFHSHAGGWGQAEEVFVQGVGIPERWEKGEPFSVLENGFGFGVNFAAVWWQWMVSRRRPERLSYVGIEGYPRSAADLREFWGRVLSEGKAPRAVAPLVEDLCAQWPLPVTGWHRLVLAEGRLALTLVWGKAEVVAPQIVGRFDALFLDGFAPDRNPEMWGEELLHHLAQRLRAGGRVATWCVAGRVRRALAQAGLEVVRRPGYGGKRERLEAYAPCRGPGDRRQPERVIVVGAGLAGSATALTLAERGVAVTLLEAGERPAGGASGNPAGVARWLPSRDDNVVAEGSRSGLLLLRRRWQRWAALGASGGWVGVAQVARSAPEEERLREIASALALPRGLLEWVEAEELSARVGSRVLYGGWWFAVGGWVSPASLARAWLQAYPVSLLGGRQVTGLVRGSEGWRVCFREQGGREGIAEAEAVVLATGAGVRSSEGGLSLATVSYPGVPLPLVRVRGQVSWRQVTAEMPPWAVVTGSGYVVPPAATGMLLFGATAQRDDFDGRVRRRDHEENGARLARLLPEVAQRVWNKESGEQKEGGEREEREVEGEEQNKEEERGEEMLLGGRVSWRTTVRDHRPLIGALPLSQRWDDPRREGSGLWTINGLGARGVVWALLGAELLADRIVGAPLPVSRRLAKALDVARLGRWKEC